MGNIQTKNKASSKLGTDSIGKLLFEFSTPAIAAMIISSLYNIIDTIFLAQAFPDGTGAAVASLAMPVMTLLIALAMFAGQGGNSLAALLLGKGQNKRVEQVLANTVLILIFFYILIVILFSLFCDQILQLLGTPLNLWAETQNFLHIIIYGSITAFLGVGINNFIRTACKPKLALGTTASGSIVCIILNYIFVMRLGWGIEGSAFATISGQLCTMILVLSFFCFSKSSPFKFRREAFSPKSDIIKQILQLGLPSFCLNLASTLFFIIMNRVIGYWGQFTNIGVQGSLACIGIALKVSNFATLPMIGISMGSQTLIGYNYGAHNWARTLKALKYAIISSMLIGCASWILCEIFPEPIINLFGVEPNLKKYSVTVLQQIMIFTPLIGFSVVGGMYFQNSGQPLKSTFLGLTRQILILIPMFIVMPFLLCDYLHIFMYGIDVAILCIPAADLASFILCFSFIIYEVLKVKKWVKNPACANPKI